MVDAKVGKTDDLVLMWVDELVDAMVAKLVDEMVGTMAEMD